MASAQRIDFPMMRFCFEARPLSHLPGPFAGGLKLAKISKLAILAIFEMPLFEPEKQDVGEVGQDGHRFLKATNQLANFDPRAQCGDEIIDR